MTFQIKPCIWKCQQCTAIAFRAGRSSLTTPTLVGPKILPFGVKVLYFKNFGLTNNCLVKAFLKWLDQSRTPSATLGLHHPDQEGKISVQKHTGWPLILEILEMSWDFILSWKCPGRLPIFSKRSWKGP